jgi:molybdenum cofactor cytidylyltransferase
VAPAEIVVNHDWEKGQLSSLHAAMKTLPPNTDGMLLFDRGISVGQFLSERPLIDEFLSSRAPVVVPSYQGRRGHPVIFSAAVYHELLNAPLDQGARAVVWLHKGEVSEVSTTEEGCVLNLNDPHAMAKLDGAQFLGWRQTD